MEENQQEPANINVFDKADDIDKAIVRLRIENPAIAIKDIAERLGIHRDTVAKRLKKEQVIVALRDLQRPALQILLDAQSDAARQLVRYARHDRPEIGLKACVEILKGVLEENINVNVQGSSLRRFLEGITDEEFEELVRDEKE